MTRLKLRKRARNRLIRKARVNRPIRSKNKRLLHYEKRVEDLLEETAVPPIADTALSTYTGLSHAEAKHLLASGKGNLALKKPTRSTFQILIDNIFTYFNFINAALGVVVLIISLKNPVYFRNMLFMGVVVVNTAISALQEISAKRTIDKLSILTEPHAEVVRSGEQITIPVEEIVPGDLLHVSAGQQIVIDGRVVSADGLEVDESLLTGESDPIRKRDADAVLSGSVAMAGSGNIVVDKVSRDTFAARITLEAQSEKNQTSALMRGLNKLLKYVSYVLFPLGIILFAKLFLTTNGGTLVREQVTTVGLLISMLPEGLILLTSMALAASIVVLGQKMALVQTMPSIETLARVDVLCLDKTGTITSGEMRLFSVVDLESKTFTLSSDEIDLNTFGKTLPDFEPSPHPNPELEHALQEYCSHFPSGNATQTALNQYFSKSDSQENLTWKRELHMAFSSQRKWSCVSFENQGTWYIGAAEKLFTDHVLGELRPLIEKIASLGYRVLTLAHSPQQLQESDLDSENPLLETVPKALLIVADEIRSDVAQTFDYFRQQNVTIKIISGDHPYTVEGIAKRAGIAGFDSLIDMSQIEESADLSEIAEKYQLFGRVSPFQKRALLKALKGNGHTVAMTGDGVNDVLALKDADCGVAMASGSEAARAAADIVLMDNKMSVMVDAVYEGRRVINNIQRIAPLFLIKTTYASVFALLMLILPMSFPILPIQGSLIGSVTVGIPGFFLALKPNRERVSGTFLANVVPLALPPGISAAISLIVAVFLSKPLGLSSAELSTVSMIILIYISLLALYVASQPFDWIKVVLFVVCVTVPFIAIAFFPGLFMLAFPPGSEWLYFAGLIAFTVLSTELLYRLFRTAQIRKLIRQKFGLSREDLLIEASNARGTEINQRV